MPTFSSPQAFELCEGGTCGDYATEGHHISCPPSDACGKGGCYCELFRRPSGSADTVPWEVPPADHNGKIKHQFKKFDYKCLCVKPILGGERTEDGVIYAFRYVLCGSGACGPLRIEVIDNPAPKVTHTEIKCTGKCDGDCKCTLFRLQVSAAGPAVFDPKDAKWELIAKADKQVVWDANYVYRCFCLK